MEDVPVDMELDINMHMDASGGRGSPAGRGVSISGRQPDPGFEEL
jgi:hypothetical protein